MPFVFDHVWLLLLVVPALALTLIPYFMMSKKYRCTRNRIISMVLHCLVMVLAISVLAGIKITYSQPYLRNEVILLVDASSSSRRIESQKDEFIRDVINSCKDEFKLGIVVFGFDEPSYVAELSYDTKDHYLKYMSASVIDDSATDIASALMYSKDLFSDPRNGKILLVSDGLETDGKAVGTIMTLVAEGVKVDVCTFSSEFYGDEVQIMGMDFPEFSIQEGDIIDIDITIKTTKDSEIKITLFDNDQPVEEKRVQLSLGEQKIRFTQTIDGEPFHEFSAVIDANWDSTTQNNSYRTYIFAQKFDKILVIERSDGESEILQNVLSSTYSPTIINIMDAPTDVSTLRQFDQVILVNIANSDMPQGLDVALNSYVYDFGGGVFTVGGSKINEHGLETFNTYDPDDMYEPITKRETLYQKMLPVHSIEYTPPLGLVIVIDRSGSMFRNIDGDTKTYMDLAKQGAIDVVNELSERDSVGIVSFSTAPTEVCRITSITERQKILDSIEGIYPSGDTMFFGAIEMASQALQALTNVDKRHIIFLSDGAPMDSHDRIIALVADYYAKAGITMSTLSIAADPTGETLLNNMAAAGHGSHYPVSPSSAASIPDNMRTDVKMNTIPTLNVGEFTPQIKFNTNSNVTRGISQDIMPTLGGFYGTKTRDVEGVLTPILTDSGYAPIFAQWKYGEGQVGSLMTSLNWAYEFVTKTTEGEDAWQPGKQLILNMVRALFPSKAVQPQDITITLDEDNYGNIVQAITSVNEGETLHLSVKNSLGENIFEPLNMDIENGSGSCSFIIKAPGVYKIEAYKKDAQGQIIASSISTAYKKFSYSKEYDVFVDPQIGVEIMQNIAAEGEGKVITDAGDVYNELAYSETEEYDPRLAFILTALVLLLLDIAVRKFKFKWPHEIVRERKLKKEMMAKRTAASGKP